MKIFDENLDFNIINQKEFKEDSVREVIINPILKALGYTAFGEHKIIRSKNLKHPYTQFGTKKESINIIPDYLCEVDGNPMFVLDAKSPLEKINTGKNVEQAFSYAIHREVRVQIYALCNGKELIIYHVDSIDPVFQSKISQIENKWDELYKIISPLAFLNPSIFNYKPDFGIRLLKSGVAKDFECHFMGLWIGTVGKVNDESFTISSVIPFGGDCLGTFDFTKEQFSDFMMQVPDEKYEIIRRALTSYPYVYHTETKDDSFEIAFSCCLSEKIQSNSNEAYLPLNIIEFTELDK